MRMQSNLRTHFLPSERPTRNLQDDDIYSHRGGIQNNPRKRNYLWRICGVLDREAFVLVLYSLSLPPLRMLGCTAR